MNRSFDLIIADYDKFLIILILRDANL